MSEMSNSQVIEYIPEISLGMHLTPNFRTNINVDRRT